MSSYSARQGAAPVITWINEQNTTRHVTPDQHRYCLQMADHIAGYFHIDAAALTQRNRSPRVCFGRHLLCFVLSRHGLILEQIARFLSLHHSSVHHSIRVIERRATEPQIVAFLESLPRGTYYESLDFGLAGAVRRQPASDGRAILAYIHGDLLGRRIPPGESAMERCHGLYLLQRDPSLAREVGKVLDYFHEHGAAASLLGRLRRGA